MSSVFAMRIFLSEKLRLCNLQNGIPDAYSDPIATFLQREGYVYLPSIMQMGMVPYGYGDVTETPTVCYSTSSISLCH